MLPTSRLEQYEAKVAALKEELEKVKGQIDSIRSNCQHSWSDIVFLPGEEREYVRPPYEQEYYGPHWKPSSISFVKPLPPKWIRKCTNCGLVQETSATKLIRSGTLGLHREIPDFGGN